MNQSKSHSTAKTTRHERSRTYLEYHKKHHNKRNVAAKIRKKQRPRSRRDSQPLTKTLLTRDYLCNKFNILRLFVLGITFILLNVAILYAVGSVLTLQYEDFWCPNYSWEEIISHHKAENSSFGDTECHTGNRLTVSNEKLYATDVNNSALIAAILFNIRSIVKCLIFTVLAILLLYLLVKYSIVCLIDCKKTINNEWYVTNI